MQPMSPSNYPPGYTNPDDDLPPMTQEERDASPGYGLLLALDADGLLTILCADCPHPLHSGVDCEELVPEPWPGADAEASPDLVRCWCPNPPGIGLGLADHNGDKAWVAQAVRDLALEVIQLANLCARWDADPGHGGRFQAFDQAKALRPRVDAIEALV